MKCLLYTCILLLHLTQLPAQSINTTHADSLINHYAKVYSLVGLSIGTVHKGKIETNSYGHTSHDSQIAITDSTLFNIASVTKLFTTTAIMQLVEDNKLSLSDKVHQLLPAFSMKDKRYKDISVAHLLTHSSGLMWNNKLKHSPDNETALLLYLAELKNKKLAFEPGTKMSYATYSNVAFDLLGMIIEKLTGQPYEAYVEERQLARVGMHSSGFDAKSVDSCLLALPQIVAGDSKAIKRLNFEGVDREKNPISNGEPLDLVVHHTIGETYEHNPSGNLLSSSGELVSWMDNMLRTAKQDDDKGLISKSSLAELWEPQHLAHGKNISIGLGWWIKDDEKYGRSYFHVGTNPGYCSILMLYPEKDFGIVILSNGWYGKEAVWNKLFYELVGMYLK